MIGVGIGWKCCKGQQEDEDQPKACAIGGEE